VETDNAAKLDNPALKAVGKGQAQISVLGPFPGSNTDEAKFTQVFPLTEDHPEKYGHAKRVVCKTARLDHQTEMRLQYQPP
jgi:hypothetical protein